MKKVLVAEIGQSTLVLSAFANLNTDTPLLIGQVVTDFGLREGLSLLEKDIGALNTEDLECFIVSPLGQEQLQQVFKTSNYRGKVKTTRAAPDEISEPMGMLEQWSKAEIVKPFEAIRNLSSVFLEEVGEVLILDSDGGSVNLYLMQRDKPSCVGEGPEVSQGSRSWVNSTLKAKPTFTIDFEPKTAEELAAHMDETAQTLREAIQDFCSQGSDSSLAPGSIRDLTNLRWVIGTGNALTTLPGGVEVIRESLMHCSSITFPEAGLPILIDQDNILTSLGALSGIYPHGAWLLLLESLGVDS